MYTLRISLYMDKGGVIVSKKNESGSATNKVGAFLSKTKNSIVNVVDKDGDGKFSAKDISIAAGAVGESVKSGVVAIKDFTEEKSKINEYKTLQPIFPQTLNEGDFFLPKFIRVKERSKKYAESEKVPLLFDTDMEQYSQMYQHYGCELYNQITASNGVTRYNLVWKPEKYLEE